MTTPILGITEISASQNQKEVTANQMVRDLEAAGNDLVTVTVTGNTTLTGAQFNRAWLIRLTGSPASDFNLTVPANKRAFVIDNQTGRTGTVTRGSGATVAVLTAERRLLGSDGTDIVALAPAHNLTGGGGGGGGGGAPVFKGALVKRTATQSIPNNTLTLVNWTAETYDTDGFHDNATNNTRLTIPAGVTKAVLAANIRWVANSTGTRVVILRKNGAYFDGDPILRHTATGEAEINIVSAAIEVTAGDYFEVEVFQNSGAALNIDSTASPQFSWFAVYAVQYSAFRGALVSRATDLSIPNNAETAIAWTEEQYDTDTIHDNATNNSRLTVPTGITRVRLTASVSLASAGLDSLRIFKNGVVFKGMASAFVGGTTGQRLNVTTPVLVVVATDYFEAMVFQDSGAAINLLAAESSFAMEIVE